MRLTEQRCVDNLVRIEKDLDEIIELIRSAQPRSTYPERSALAKEKLRALKSMLKEEYRVTNLSRTQAQLSQFERSMYAPAISEVLHNNGVSAVRLNMRPERWSEGLGEACASIRYWLGQMSDVKK